MTHATAVKAVALPADTPREANGSTKGDQPGLGTVAVPSPGRSGGDGSVDPPPVGIDAIRRPGGAPQVEPKQAEPTADPQPNPVTAGRPTRATEPTGATEAKEAEDATPPVPTSYAEMTAAQMSAALAGDAKPGSVKTIPLGVLPASMQAFIKRLQGLLNQVDRLDLADLPAVTMMRHKIKTGARSWHQDDHARIPPSPEVVNTRVGFFAQFLAEDKKPLPNKQVLKGIEGIKRPLREYTAMGWKEAEQSGRLIYDPLADVFYLTCQHYMVDDVYFCIEAPRAAANGGGGATPTQVSREEFDLLLFQAWEEVAEELQFFLDVRDRRKRAQQADGGSASGTTSSAEPNQGGPSSKAAQHRQPPAKKVTSQNKETPQKKETAEAKQRAEREEADFAIAKATAAKLGQDPGACVVELDAVRRLYVEALDRATSAFTQKAEAAKRTAELDDKMAKFGAPKKVKEDKKQKSTPANKSRKGGKSREFIPDAGGTFTYNNREWATFTWQGAEFLVDSQDAYIGYFDHNDRPANDRYPLETTIGELAALFQQSLGGHAEANKPTAIMLAGLLAEPIRHPTAALEALFAVTRFSPFSLDTKAFKGHALPMTTGGTIATGGVPTAVMYSELGSAKAVIDAVLKDAQSNGNTLYEQLSCLGAPAVLVEIKQLLYLALGDPLKRVKAVKSRDERLKLPEHPLPVNKSVVTPIEPAKEKAGDPSRDTNADVRSPESWTDGPSADAGVKETEPPVQPVVDPDSKPDPSMAPSAPSATPDPVEATGPEPSQPVPPVLDGASADQQTTPDPGTSAPQISPTELKVATADPVPTRHQGPGNDRPTTERPASVRPRHEPVDPQPYPPVGLYGGGRPEILSIEDLRQLQDAVALSQSPADALIALLAHISWQIAELEPDPGERSMFADGGQPSPSYPSRPTANLEAFRCWLLYRDLT